MHWPAREIMRDLKAQRPTPPRSVRLYVPKGSSAWNPASTSSNIHGPTHLTYTEHKDGGIDVQVTG